MQKGDARRIFLSLLPYLSLCIALSLIFFRLWPGRGLMGHDYMHYFTRLLLGVDFFWKNGFKAPHFTPYLCGGMPFFADPQAIYFSVEQFLAFFIAPLIATFATFLLFYLLGYWGMYRLVRQEFSCSKNISHATALLFILNGFTFAHLFVGHVTHYPFLLAPWILSALWRANHSRKEILRSALLLSVVAGYTFYSGGLHVLVLECVMCLVMLPALLDRKLRTGQFRSFVQVVGLSLLILFLTCSGKYLAASLFSPRFEFYGIDKSPLSLWRMLLTYFWFDPHSLPPFLFFGHWAMGSWEYVAFVSKAVAPVGILFLFFAVRKADARGWVVLLSTALLSVVVCLLAHGDLHSESLPFWKHYHNPIKILSGFTPLFFVVFAITIQEISLRFSFSNFSQGKRSLILFLFELALISEYALSSLFLISNPGARTFRYDPEIYSAMKAQGGLPEVQRVVRGPRSDFAILQSGSSSLSCYEPLFGYRDEGLHAQLKEGSVWQVSSQGWNFTQPACLLYGKSLHCRPWDRVSRKEVFLFKNFLKDKAVDAWVPAWQRAMDEVNFVAVLLTLSLWVAIYLPLSRKADVRMVGGELSHEPA